METNDIKLPMNHIHFINAGAGAGKTTELVCLFCEYLLNGKISRKNGLLVDTNEAIESVSITADKILLTTFTRAAAGEFKDRIKDILLKNHRSDLISSVDSAMIGTLDSICQQYIQKYWYLLEISPKMELKDEMDSRKVLKNLLNDKDIATEGDLHFFNSFADELNILKQEGTANKIHYDFWRDHVIKMIETIQLYSLDINCISDFKESTLKMVSTVPPYKPEWSTFKKYADDLKKEIEGKKQPETFYQNHIENCLIEEEFPNITNLIELNKAKKAGYWTKYSTDLFDETRKICLSRYADLYRECSDRIFNIVYRLFPKFKHFKVENNLLDYTDLEIKFLELLKMPSVQKDLASSLECVMVDEFQDINPIQLKIYQKLTDIVYQSYWVGDPKQAIYGFRGSDSQLAKAAISTFPIIPHSTKEEEDQLILSEEEVVNGKCLRTQKLGTSHRSLPFLVDTASQIFTKAFSAENLGESSSEVLTQDQVELCPWKRIKGPLQENLSSKCNGKFIYHLWKSMLNKTGQSTDRNKHSQLYPDFARCVRSMISDDSDSLHYVSDSKTGDIRAVTYGDIAILTHSNADCDKIGNALVEAGIPVSIEQRDIQDQIEVRLIFSFLKYIYNQDERLCKAEIQKLWGNLSLEDNLKTFLDEKNVDSVFDLLDEIKKQYRYNSVYNTLLHLIGVLDLNHYVAKWSFSANRVNNINSLLCYAEEFSKRNNEASIMDFIDYVKERDIKTDFVNIGDTVKVLTYHKAKGLEWKIVILDSLYYDWKDHFYTKDLIGAKIMMDTENKPYLNYFPPMKDFYMELLRDIDIPSIHSLYLKKKAEIVRLMYVGFTRAEDFIIIPSFGACPLLMLDAIDYSVNGLPEVKIQGIPDQRPDQLVPYLKAQGPKEYPLRKLTPSLDKGNTGGLSICSDVRELPLQIDLNDPASEVSSTDMGTCVHNFMAIFKWNGQNNISLCHDWNLARAQRLISNFSMDGCFSAENLVLAAEAFFTQLENLYGTDMQFEREVPVKHYLEDGRYVDGEIDLLIRLAENNTYVIVDYKNVLQESDNILQSTKTYLSQLSFYQKAVEASAVQAKVKEMYIAYLTLGKMVKVEPI